MVLSNFFSPSEKFCRAMKIWTCGILIEPDSLLGHQGVLSKRSAAPPQRASGPRVLKILLAVYPLRTRTAQFIIRICLSGENLLNLGKMHQLLSSDYGGASETSNHKSFSYYSTSNILLPVYCDGRRYCKCAYRLSPQYRDLMSSEATLNPKLFCTHISA